MMSNQAKLPSFNQREGDIYVIGLNHQSAPTEVREKVAPLENSQEIITELKEDTNVQEAVPLATCNRNEWVFYSDQQPDIKEWLRRKTTITAKELDKYLFILKGRAAIAHLFRVASGLDSLILGETQILGQLKAAYRMNKFNNGLGSVLERLFQQSFSVAKHIRNTTGIGENPISVAYAGVQLTKQFFDDYPQRTALIIGAGETASLAAKYLKELNIRRIIIANRNLNNAHALANQVDGYAIELQSIPLHLFEADIVVGAAKLPQPLISKIQTQQAIKKRQDAFQVYVDLGVPRNFDGKIAKVANAFLYSIDDLEQIIDHNKMQRKEAALQADVIVDMFVDDFCDWLDAKPQHQIIRHIRGHANDIRQTLLQEAYRKLSHGEDPAKILDEMSYKLTNKLLHHPSAMINAIPPNHKDWLAIIADTFETERHS